jgi:L-malate glycosyltransferase
LPRFKENALKRAQEFDITKILPLYENYYHKILQKAASKATI